MEHSQVKSPTIHGYFLEIAENILEWEPVSIDTKQPITAIITTNKDRMHRINSISRMMPEWQHQP